MLSESLALADSSEAVYKCKKCRKSLFDKEALLPHVVGMGTAAFDWRAHRVRRKEHTETCEMSLFTEPLNWMSEAILSMDGKVRHFYMKDSVNI